MGNFPIKMAKGDEVRCAQNGGGPCSREAEPGSLYMLTTLPMQGH